VTTASSPRWTRKSDARPDEILDAALAVFDAAGFDAARMEDVARQAGLSKAGVYLYFRSKEALLIALIQREIAPLAQRLEAIAAAGAAQPVETLRLLARTAIGFLGTPRIFAVPRLVISCANRFPEIAALYRTEVVDRGRNALAGLFRAGMEQGVFRTIDPEFAVRTIGGPIMFETLWRNVLGGAPLLEDPVAFADRLVDHVLNGLAAVKS